MTRNARKVCCIYLYGWGCYEDADPSIAEVEDEMKRVAELKGDNLKKYWPYINFVD